MYTDAPIRRAIAICLVLAGGSYLESVRPALAQNGCGAAVTVRSGDTLNRIASRCGTSVSRILRLNPSITNPSRVFVGQRIRLTGGASVDSGPSVSTYRVRRGDSLASIARRHGVSLRELLAANRLVNPNRIRIGIVITIPGRGSGGGGGGGGSQPFVTVEGEVTDEGVECLAMRDDNGRLYTLIGNVRRLRPGDFVEVRGVRAEASFCQQGRTIDVVRARVIEEGNGGDPGGDFVSVRGVLTNEGVECQALRSTGGRLYTFSYISGYEAGDSVEVSGTIADFSFCQQGTTIAVENISRYP